MWRIVVASAALVLSCTLGVGSAAAQTGGWGGYGGSWRGGGGSWSGGGSGVRDSGDYTSSRWLTDNAVARSNPRFGNVGYNAPIYGSSYYAPAGYYGAGYSGPAGYYGGDYSSPSGYSSGYYTSGGYGAYDPYGRGIGAPVPMPLLPS